MKISPKVIAPVLTALSAVAASWITTGSLDRAELAVLAVAAIGAVAGYLAPPGDVTGAYDDIDPTLDEALDAPGDVARPESGIAPDPPEAAV